MAVSTGTYASRPSTHNTGDIYLTTDSFWDYLISDGAEWKHLYSGFECEPPIDSEFSWLNQGACLLNTNGGGIHLRASANASTQIGYRIKSVPTAPYILTALFLPTVVGVLTTQASYGIILRNAGNGKIATLELGAIKEGIVTSYRLAVRYLNNATTFAIVEYWHLLGMHLSSPGIWLRAEDDETDIIHSFSLDGENFLEVLRRARTYHFSDPPDQIGFFILNTSTTYDCGATLIHWSQPNPVSTMRMRGFFLGSGMANNYGSGSTFGVFG